MANAVRQSRSRQVYAGWDDLCGASEVCLGGLVLVAALSAACSTKVVIAFASEDVGKFPSTMLYNHAFTGLLGFVFCNARLQCFEIVGVGYRVWHVLYMVVFGVEEGRIEGRWYASRVATHRIMKVS